MLPSCSAAATRSPRALRVACFTLSGAIHSRTAPLGRSRTTIQGSWNPALTIRRVLSANASADSVASGVRRPTSWPDILSRTAPPKAIKRASRLTAARLLRPPKSCVKSDLCSLQLQRPVVPCSVAKNIAPSGTKRAAVTEPETASVEGLGSPVCTSGQTFTGPSTPATRNASSLSSMSTTTGVSSAGIRTRIRRSTLLAGCRDVFPPHPERQPKTAEQSSKLSASKTRTERPSFRGNETIEEIDAGLDVEVRPSLADRIASITPGEDVEADSRFGQPGVSLYLAS